ncbi:hypothetical protein FOG50_02331 [Hanseniaspora uvarum]|nr:hypothetical protein FOG50_02331 [Hanseniaspora uvarum]
MNNHAENYMEINQSNQYNPGFGDSSNDSKPHTKGTWSKIEDEKLMGIVEDLGGDITNWTDISKKMVPFTRTPKQCRERYHQNLKPNLNKDPITEEEGEKINYMVIKHGKKWAFIARSLNNGRSDNTVKNWWNLKEGKKKRLKAKLEKKKLIELKANDNPDEKVIRNDVSLPSQSIQPLDTSINIDNRNNQAMHINGLNMNPKYEWMSNELAKGNLIGMPTNNYVQPNLRPYDHNVTNKTSIFNQNIFNNNQSDFSQMDGMMGFMKSGLPTSNSYSDLTKFSSMQFIPQIINGRMQSIDSFVPNNLNYSPASNNSTNEQHRVSITHSALSTSNNLPILNKEEVKGNRSRENSIFTLNQTPMPSNILPVSRRASQFFLQQQNTDITNDKFRQSNITFRQPFVQTNPQNNIKKLPQVMKNNFSSPLGLQNKQENGVFKSNYSINQATPKDDRRRSTLANILNNDPE